jgi:flavin-dependent dehydrogenase
MQKCDVLIVGGGPGGSTCARELCHAGLDVLVLDKAVFPRDKVCAGWITPAVLDEIGLDLAEYRQGRVLQPITSFRVGRQGGPMIDLDYDAAVSYGIRRCEFDRYLLERSGARLQLGESLESIVREPDGWIVNDRYRTPMLVGAGGHFCPVARWLGDSGSAGDTLVRAASKSSRPVVAAQEIEFALDEVQEAECRVESQRPELYFCRDLTGYGWCFRKGNYLNIGLGREDPQRVSEHVAAFCAFLQEQGRIPRKLPGKFHGHAYLLYDHSARELLADGLLLIGDAAGLAYTQSGEGIRPAIESGLLAAEVIRAAAGDYREERLQPYRRLLEQRFGKRCRRPSPAGQAPSPWRQFLAGRLLANRWFVRRVVMDRWFLHSNQPPPRNLGDLVGSSRRGHC